VGSVRVAGTVRCRQPGDVADLSVVPTKSSVGPSGHRLKILKVRKPSLHLELPGRPSVPRARGGGGE
jgi:hypothetical protein